MKKKKETGTLEMCTLKENSHRRKSELSKMAK